MRHDVVVFGGITFIRFPESRSKSARRYYYAFVGGKRAKGIGALHQEIWKAHYGPIPPGHEVHHSDHNPLNNSVENLEVLTRKEHRRRHGSRSPAQVASFKKTRQDAARWHGSPEGRAWHSEHGKKTWEKRKPVRRVCLECSQPYDSFAGRLTDKYCSNACGQRRACREKVYHTPALCAFCAASFLRPRPRGGKTQRCCSKTCAQRLRAKEARERSGLQCG